MATENRLLEKDLFTAALEMPTEERSAFLQRRCGSNVGLRAGVESMLANYRQADSESFLTESFLVKPPWAQDRVFPRLDDFDEFERIEYLGHGGMGVVYKAFDNILQTEVALKMSLVPGDNLVEEPRKLARLHHAHIVQVHKIGKHGDRPFFSMNLIKGRNLDRRLGEFGKNPRAAVELMIKVARAVQHAHQGGILHRDLKPANILLEDAGDPIVTDFGLAVDIMLASASAPEAQGHSDSASRSYQGIVGTASFMSPEQAHSPSAPTIQSDVYGLGAVLYAMLTGRPPFLGIDLADTLRLVRDPHRAPVLPRSLNPRVDLDLQAICMKCLNKNKAARYVSAEELASDLQRWLDSRETVACPWSRPYRLWRWCKRNPLVMGMGMAAIALLAMMDIGNAFALLSEREAQALSSNGNTARSVANTVRTWLQHYTHAAAREANDEWLRTHLKSPTNREELGRWIARLQASYADPSNGFPRTGNAHPIASWFLMDRDGTVVAHTESANAVGHYFAWRDYFKGASDLSAKGSAHVSRVYWSHVSGQCYKFAVAAPVLDGNDLLGVLVLTVMADTAKETLLPESATQEAVLVGRWDGGTPVPANPEIPTAIHPAGQRLILLHSSFERGDTAVEIHNPFLFADETNRQPHYGRDRDYRDPVAVRDDRYAGRWLAASAPVEHTEFIVIVQQRYDEAIQPYSVIGRPLLLWSAVGVGMLACVLAMVASAIMRSRRLV